MLRRRRRRDVIVETAVFVIRDEDNRILPAHAVAYGVHYRRYKVLAFSNVGRRMLIVLGGRSENKPEVRIDERNGWQRAGRGLRKKRGDRQDCAGW